MSDPTDIISRMEAMQQRFGRLQLTDTPQECDPDNPCGKCSDCREEAAYANECANPSDGLGY